MFNINHIYNQNQKFIIQKKIQEYINISIKKSTQRIKNKRLNELNKLITNSYNYTGNGILGIKVIQFIMHNIYFIIKTYIK